MKPKKKPTTAEMVGRIPRWLLGFEKRITAQLALNRLDIQSLKSGQKMLSERMESVYTLADNAHDLSQLSTGRLETLAPIVKHCERLMREKIALQDRAFEAEWKLANDFMAAPIPTLRDAI